MRLRNKRAAKLNSHALIALATLPLALNTASVPAEPMAGVAADTEQRVEETVLPDPAPAPVTAPQVRLSPLPAPPEYDSGIFTIGSPKAGEVWKASTLAESGIPHTALQAYKRAAQILGAVDPSCQLPWTLVAAIGRVESNHGRYAGATLGADGVSKPLIIGVPLNGVGPVAAIRDSDAGQHDMDKVWDRAVGPMQFIPTTWAVVGVDGDGDGVRSPNDIDDAALAAAVYLCAGEGSVAKPAGMRAAIHRYNHSDSYVSLVMGIERSYRAGVFTVDSAPAVAVAELGDLKAGAATFAGARPEASAALDKGTPAKPGATKSDDGKQADKLPADKKPADKKPDQNEPAPDPAPDPATSPDQEPAPVDPASEETPPPVDPAEGEETPPVDPAEGEETPPPPAEPVRVVESGTLEACATGYCVNGPLDLGDTSQPAMGDYDEDGTVELRSEELAGLVGRTVSLLVENTTAGRVVYQINGAGYRG